jgi:hypothetical protein
VRQLKVFERHHIALIDMHEVSQKKHGAWSMEHREKQLFDPFDRLRAGKLRTGGQLAGSS